MSAVERALERLLDEVDALDMSWYDDPTILGVREAADAARSALEASAVPSEVVYEATCACGANPPRRPWTEGAGDDPCRDGNGNFRPGHEYANIIAAVLPTSAVPEPTDLRAARAMVAFVLDTSRYPDDHPIVKARRDLLAWFDTATPPGPHSRPHPFQYAFGAGPDSFCVTCNRKRADAPHTDRPPSREAEGREDER